MHYAGPGSIARPLVAPDRGILAADFVAGLPMSQQRTWRGRLARTSRYEPSMEQAAA